MFNRMLQRVIILKNQQSRILTKILALHAANGTQYVPSSKSNYSEDLKNIIEIVDVKLKKKFHFFIS